MWTVPVVKLLVLVSVTQDVNIEGGWVKSTQNLPVRAFAAYYELIIISK